MRDDDPRGPFLFVLVLVSVMVLFLAWWVARLLMGA